MSLTVKPMHQHKISDAVTGEITFVPFTEEEEAECAAWAAEEPVLQMKRLRQVRNERLAETDHFALADVTLTDEMREYRQALRDLPANTTDPANPVWPTKPE